LLDHFILVLADGWMVEEKVWEVGWWNGTIVVLAPPCVVDRVTTREGAAAYLSIFSYVWCVVLGDGERHSKGRGAQPQRRGVSAYQISCFRASSGASTDEPVLA
jgi:hypothetical protein